MFEINKEKHEIPKANSREIKFPWRDMKIGDSFDVPFNNKSNTRIRSSANYYMKRYDKDFKIITRGLDKFTRVWRIQ